MARGTKRSLNKCKDCGDTWYPRGRDLSKRCPSCGSTNVTYHIGCGTWLGLVIVILVAISYCNRHDEKDKSSTKEQDQQQQPAKVGGSQGQPEEGR